MTSLPLQAFHSSPSFSPPLLSNSSSLKKEGGEVGAGTEAKAQEDVEEEGREAGGKEKMGGEKEGPRDEPMLAKGESGDREERAPAIPRLRCKGNYCLREKALQEEEASGRLRFVLIRNDGTEENMVNLIALKNIFARQLPNMPREYIVRLVMDRSHKSLLLMRTPPNAKSPAVIGGITYRPFVQQGFGEIAFCAITATEQVRGFGTRLMNQLKEVARREDSLALFLTYADNNAVGYFVKQGFSKVLSLPKGKFGGFIKDYDGGTLMQCDLLSSSPSPYLALSRSPILPQLDFTQLPSLILDQRQRLHDKLCKLSAAVNASPRPPFAFSFAPAYPPHSLPPSSSPPSSPYSTPSLLPPLPPSFPSPSPSPSSSFSSSLEERMKRARERIEWHKAFFQAELASSVKGMAREKERGKGVNEREGEDDSTRMKAKDHAECSRESEEKEEKKREEGETLKQKWGGREETDEEEKVSSRCFPPGLRDVFLRQLRNKLREREGERERGRLEIDGDVEEEERLRRDGKREWGEVEMEEGSDKASGQGEDKREGERDGESPALDGDRRETEEQRESRKRLKGKGEGEEKDEETSEGKEKRKRARECENLSFLLPHSLSFSSLPSPFLTDLLVFPLLSVAVESRARELKRRREREQGSEKRADEREQGNEEAGCAVEREELHSLMKEIHKSVCEHADAWPFRDPVDAREVRDYYSVIRNPIDLKTMHERLGSGAHYLTLDIFVAEMRRMFVNARSYNAPETIYYKCANKLESFFLTKLRNAFSSRVSQSSPSVISSNLPPPIRSRPSSATPSSHPSSSSPSPAFYPLHVAASPCGNSSTGDALNVVSPSISPSLPLSPVPDLKDKL